jgi:hypothetical protein
MREWLERDLIREVRMTTAFRALVAAALILQVAVPAGAAPSPDSSTQTPTVFLRASARREGARLAATSHRGPVAQPSSQERNWVARHPVLVGTLAGAGVGLGYVAANGCSSSDYTCGGLVLFFGGTGAGLGALGGVVASLFLR